MQTIFRDGLLPALRTSPVVFRAFLRWFNLLSTPDALMTDPEIVAEVMAAYQDRENHAPPDPLGPPTAPPSSSTSRGKPGRHASLSRTQYG